MSILGRPKTRDVVREEIAAAMPAMVEAIAKALGANVGRAAGNVAQPVQPARSMQPKAQPRKVSAETRTRKMPEGGYADRFTVVPSDRGDQPRPKGFNRWDSAVQEAFEAKLSRSYNVYFHRDSDEASVAPAPQITEALKAAGYHFVPASKGRAGTARWYGERSKLPAAFKAGIERE